MSVMSRVFPFLGWAGGVTSRSVRSDMGAGLTGAVLLLPQGVAFAAIAGLPPEYGLYCAIVPAIIAALFGSSHHLMSGPTTAISLVVFANVSQLATPMTPEYIGLVLSMTLMAGVIQLGLGLGRLGGLINFVSHSVLLGFTCGAAILIATSQLSNVFGVDFASGKSFLSVWSGFFTRITDINWRVAAIAFFTLAVAILIKRFKPRAPALLLAMILGAGLSWLLSGQDHGVKLVGALPRSLPPFSIPGLDLDGIYELMPAALAVAMLGLAEASSISRAVASQSHQRIDNNQEFIGQGLANIVGSFFSSYASSGSFTRTGVNYEAGATSPLAAVFSAVFVAVILLLAGPMTAWLPIPCMGGVLLLVSWHLIKVKDIRMLFRTSKAESGIMIATFLSTLFFRLEMAVFSGVLLSLLLYLQRTSNPHFSVLAPVELPKGRHFMDVSHTGQRECPQLKVLRLDGSIFFGAVNHIEEAMSELLARSPEQCHILFVASGVNFIDVSGCGMLFHENSELHDSGRQLYLCSVKAEVEDVLRRGGCVNRLGRENIFADKEEALASIVPRLDPERCSECRVRLFLECAGQPGPEDMDEPTDAPPTDP